MVMRNGPTTAIALDVGPRFAGGRALVVAVANYEHVKPLPGAVLNDARDV